MIEQTYKDIYDEQLAKDAIINDRHPGFKEDYLVLVCLLKKYKIKNCLEVGTHCGFGTKIIKQALGENSIVYSLDLPDEEHNISKQHPLSEGKKGVGYECDLQFFQLRGNSMTFDFSQFKCEGFYIDAEHKKENVQHEVTEILKTNPKIVILHDCDMSEVYQGIINAIEGNTEYEFYRIVDTRIGYLLKKG